MNKGELVDVIASTTNVTKKEADAILAALVDTIMAEVSQGNKVTLVGFGSFERRERQARDVTPKQGRKCLSLPLMFPRFLQVNYSKKKSRRMNNF